MKLSEAIRLAAMDHPQAKGIMIAFDASGVEARCALGGAYKMVGGVATNPIYPEQVAELFPICKKWVPAEQEPQDGYRPQIPVTVSAEIMFLNDSLGYTRQEIADWVEGVENQFEAQAKEASDVCEVARR